MDKQAKKAKEQLKALPFKERVSNFWYYHKSHVIISALLVVLVVFVSVEFFNITENDINLSYYSSFPIDEEGLDAFKDALKPGVKDVNASGTIDISIIAAYADPSRKDEQTHATLTRLQAELISGERAGYIVDEVYKKILEESYPEIIENVVEITDIPEAKASIKGEEDAKLYFVTRRVYQQEINDRARLEEHEVALGLEEFLKSMIIAK